MGTIQPDVKFGSGTDDAVVLQGFTRQLSWNAEMDGPAGTCKTGAGSAPDATGWESDVHTAESGSVAESNGSRRPAQGKHNIPRGDSAHAAGMFAGRHSVFVGNICAPPVGIGGYMFTLDSNHRYFMCRQPVNMRKGIDALFNLIQSESPLSPMTGDVFVFFSRNRQSVKLLRWDTDGFLLYQKRLEKGSFEQPRLNPSTGYHELSWETFSLIMSGVSLESVRFRKRYRTRFAGM
mgnify:CR=1 FL=1